MKTAVGIAVASDRVRAVAVRGGAVRWAAQAEFGEERALSAAIADMLSAAPLPRWRRTSVTVAIGPAIAQTKILRELPPVEDPRMLDRLVQENAARFFLRNGEALRTAPIQVVETGSAWAAAFDEEVVGAIEEACRAARLRLRAILPTVAVLGRALRGARLVWTDGSLVAEVTLAEGKLVSVRRFRRSGPVPSTAPPQAVEALTSLREVGWRFADAYGAAVAPGAGPLALRPGHTGVVDVPRWRLTLAAIVALIALTAAALGPGLIAKRAERGAEHRIALIDADRRTALAAEAQLRQITAALAEVAAFDRDRRSLTLFLAELSRALPERAAVSTLQLDSVGATAVVLAPGGARVVAALERLPGVVAPRIIGPVTREVLGGTERERITVRLHFDPAAPRRKNLTRQEPR